MRNEHGVAMNCAATGDRNQKSSGPPALPARDKEINMSRVVTIKDGPSPPVIFNSKQGNVFGTQIYSPIVVFVAAAVANFAIVISLNWRYAIMVKENSANV